MVFSACVVLAITLLLVLGHYTRREPVSGTLVPTHGLLTVSVPSAGSITRIFVREGDRVRAGQLNLPPENGRQQARGQAACFGFFA